MATAKKAAPAKAAKTPSKKPAAKAPAKAASKPAAPAAAATVKPLKELFSKSSLIAHVAAQAGVEPKAAKAVLGALDATILGSVNKKGAGEFTLPGLLKIGVQKVPAKKARKGIDPFTKQERMFAAKPASVKIKVRALKKLKDAAL
jgi:nucleoid DNA-binding protein